MQQQLALLALAAVGGCAYTSPPVKLQGAPAATATLTGDWDGAYWSGGPGDRRGTLKFYIGPGADSTFGDVAMLTPLGLPVQPVDQGPAHRAHTRLAQSLRVDFARVTSDSVTGVLEPYIAPDCECEVSTTFIGAIVGDTIRGTFATRGMPGGNRDGAWRLVRRRVKE